jgi:dTDP-4-amino-4,6-dideoxygalactose transaminase
VTNDIEIAEKVKRLRNYGQRVKYHHIEQGVNARLDTLQAAILSVKLRHLEKWNQLRRDHAERYTEYLTGIGDLVLQEVSPENTHIYHLFIIRTEQRDELQKFLTARGVNTVIHYPIPVHQQQAYTDLGYKLGDFPNAEFLANRILSLPMFPELSDAQIQYTCDQIKAFFTKAA